MSWQTANLQFPASMAAVGDSLDDVINGAGADASSLHTRLGGLTATAFTPGALASSATAAASARADFDAHMNGAGTFCAVHPYMHGVREQGSSGFYLSFPNAIARLAEKLLDANDGARPVSGSTQAAMVLALSDTTLAGFKDKLVAFNAVFPTAPLVTAQRRAQAQLAQEQTRYTIKQSAQAPAFAQLPWATLPTVRAVKNSVGARLSMAESYNAENMSPTTELAGLLTEKQAHAAAQVAAYTALQTQFSGSPCRALYLEENTNHALRSSLLGASGGAGHDQSLTAALLFVGAPAELVFLRELFGV